MVGAGEPGCIVPRPTESSAAQAHVLDHAPTGRRAIARQRQVYENAIGVASTDAKEIDAVTRAGALELVSRGLDVLHPEIDFGLAAMVGGVSEVAPDALVADQFAALRA